MTGEFLRLKQTDKGGGGAKERDARRAPCTSWDVILNLPSGFDSAALMEERLKYEEGQDGSIWRSATRNRRRELPVRVIGVGVKIRANFLAYYRCSVPVYQTQIPSILFLHLFRASGGADNASTEQESFPANKSTATLS